MPPKETLLGVNQEGNERFPPVARLEAIRCLQGTLVPMSFDYG